MEILIDIEAPVPLFAQLIEQIKAAVQNDKLRADTEVQVVGDTLNQIAPSYLEAIRENPKLPDCWQTTGTRTPRCQRNH